jgi:hypothetical protein
LRLPKYGLEDSAFVCKTEGRGRQNKNRTRKKGDNLQMTAMRMSNYEGLK